MKPKIKKFLWITAVAAAIIVGGSVILWAIQEEQENDQRFHCVKKGVLYRSRQPELESSKELYRRNITKIVNLRPRSENTDDFDREQLKGDSYGVEIINIPITANLPTDQEIEKFLRIVTTNAGSTLVHCAQGRSRTGIMCACFLVVVEGWSPQDAYKDLIDRGDKSDADVLQSRLELLQRLSKDRQLWQERL